jgi:hypothetical protein
MKKIKYISCSNDPEVQNYRAEAIELPNKWDGFLTQLRSDNSTIKRLFSKGSVVTVYLFQKLLNTSSDKLKNYWIQEHFLVRCENTRLPKAENLDGKIPYSEINLIYGF